MHQPFVMTGGLRRVSSDLDTWSFRPFTDWISAQNVDNVRSTLRMLAELGNLEIRFAYQTATVVTDVTGASFFNAGPNAWVAVGSAMTANGLQTEQHAIAGGVGGSFLVRFGIAFRSTAVNALAEASCGVDVQVQQGSIALGAGVDLDLHAAPAATDIIGYRAITPWLPAAGVQDIVAGLLKIDLGTNPVTLNGCYQVADDPEFPSAWANFANIVSTTSQAVVLTDPAPGAFATHAWYRLGINWETTATSQQQSTVNIAFSGVYS